MPAMAPPESPLWCLFAAPAAPVAELEAPEFVEEGELLVVEFSRFGMAEKTGSVTPEQRPVELDVTQQESVAFSELARQ